MNEEEIRQLAQLARLDLSEEEVKRFAVEMKDIIEFCRQVNEVNTEGIETFNYSQETYNVFREDEVKECLSTEKALLNAKDIENGMFKIPKTM